MNDLNEILTNFQTNISSSDLQIAYRSISKAYRAHQPFSLNTTHLALAYILIRMPATVAALEAVMKHLKPYKGDLKTLLDLGCGPGSTLWAAKDSFSSLEKATLVDTAGTVMDLGQQIAQLSKKDCEANWVKKDIFSFLTTQSHEERPYDVVTLSYVLTELTPKLQKQTLLSSWEKTNTFLICVEPGTPKGFLNIRQARDLLITQGAKILAPCTHEQTCPLTEQDWCHFSQRLPRSKRHQDLKGSLPYEDEKYSFIIASRDTSITRPESRLVKKPLRSSGLIELSLCTDQGLKPLKISKRDQQDYKRARKVKWGDGCPDSL